MSGIDDVVEEGMESQRRIFDSRYGRVWGMQLSLQQLLAGRLMLEDHCHAGKEPTVEWQYDLIRLAAEAAGIETAKFLLLTCSDDVNRSAKFGVHSYGGAFDLINPGAVVDLNDLEIGTHDGHTRHVILNIQHIGQYKHAETGEILFGKMRGDTDGTLRECCGKLAGVLTMLKDGRSPSQGFAGLAEYYNNELANYDLENPQHFSAAMWMLAVRHMENMTGNIIERVTHLSSHKGHAKKFVVAEGISINRHYKYDSPLILAGIYVVENGTVHDLRKTPYTVADGNVAGKKLAKIVD